MKLFLFRLIGGIILGAAAPFFIVSPWVIPGEPLERLWLRLIAYIGFAFIMAIPLRGLAILIGIEEGK